MVGASGKARGPYHQESSTGDFRGTASVEGWGMVSQQKHKVLCTVANQRGGASSLSAVSGPGELASKYSSILPTGYFLCQTMCQVFSLGIDFSKLYMAGRIIIMGGWGDGAVNKGHLAST